jgi:hypothetical protein
MRNAEAGTRGEAGIGEIEADNFIVLGIKER